MADRDTGLRMSWNAVWGYLLSLPYQYQNKFAATLDRELKHWLPFTPLHVQYEVLENAPMLVIESFEMRKVRYSKPTEKVDSNGKPTIEYGFMPIVHPEVATRIKEERGEGEVVWDVKVRKCRPRGLRRSNSV